LTKKVHYLLSIV